MALKRSICSFGIILILCMTFLTGYTMSGDFVFADSVTDEWTNVTTNEQLAEAFRYYCKSRNLTIEGSIADSLTKFTTKTFKGLCNTLGINMDTLQAQIKYQTDGNLGNKFLFSALAINAYNRIFAEFLQNNDLEVGDEANEQDNTIYSEMVYVDDLGIATRVYKSPVINGSILDYSIEYGEPYKLTGSDIYYNWANGTTSFTFNINNRQYVKNIVGGSGYINNKMGKYVAVQNNVSPAKNLYIYESTDNVASGEGNFAFIYQPSTDKLYYGIYSIVYDNVNHVKLHESIYNYGEVTNRPPVTSIIFLTTNNNVINNNTYEGDTIINNNGDVINNNGDDDPSYNPYPDGGGSTTPSGNTGGGSGADDTDVTFPHFNFQLPEIDWSLGDLSQKFPFSIPFDLIAFFTVLNAEPQAPAIDADIPLGTWYTWHFEADFSQFDNYAVIIRNVEFIGFCVGLIYLTIKLVKG